MTRIRDEVRLYVTISAKSIDVARWVRSYVLREAVREVIAEGADLVTMHEYLQRPERCAVVQQEGTWKALSSMVGRISSAPSRPNACPGCASAPKPSRSAWTRIVKALKALADAAADPVAAAAKVASDAIKAKRTRWVEGSSGYHGRPFRDALVGGHVSAEGVSWHSGKTSRSTTKSPCRQRSGSTPHVARSRDCKTARLDDVSRPASSRRWWCYAIKLDKMVSAVEKARASANANSPSTREIVPNEEKVRKEQKVA